MVLAATGSRCDLEVSLTKVREIDEVAVGSCGASTGR